MPDPGPARHPVAGGDPEEADQPMNPRLADLAEALLAAARRAGADAADVLAVEGAALSVDVRAGRLEMAERAESVEIGLRVIVGRRQACVSASDVSARTLSDLGERAVAMAREAPEDPTVGLADPAALTRATDCSALELADPAEEPPPAALEDDARRAEAAALAMSGISQVDSAGASWSRRAVHLAATNGFSAGHLRTSRSISCTAITGEGVAMERDWASESRCFAADLPDAAEIGRLAAERTLARADARTPPTGTFPVIFDERVAGSLVGHLLAAVNGTAIARGASWLRDAMGADVLPRGLSVVEEPHRTRISGSRLWDAEGLPTVRRAIVARGTLAGWVLDLATARRLGLQSTANATRGMGAPPAPGVSNITLEGGSGTRAELVSAMGTGLVVTGLIGATINPTTGDYSRGASGFWVEGGEIRYAVNACTIAGNLRAMLHTLVAADDARPHLSTRVPSLLVEGLTIAGG